MKVLFFILVVSVIILGLETIDASVFGFGYRILDGRVRSGCWLLVTLFSRVTCD